MGAEIPDGAVIVARAIINSSLWTMRPADCKLAVTCICLANWKPAKWFDGQAERIIRRGEFVTSRDRLAKVSGLSVQTTRTSLRRLGKVGFLTLNLTRAYTVVYLPKYDLYQDLSKYGQPRIQPTPNPDLTHAQPTPNPRLTTIEVYNEGDEGEKGKTHTPCAPQLVAHATQPVPTPVVTPPTKSSSPADILANWYCSHNNGYLGRRLVVGKFAFFLARGMPFSSCEPVVANPATCKGRSPEEICRNLTPHASDWAHVMKILQAKYGKQTKETQQ
ncbi:MAG: hypothetical protein QME77_13670 [bacterium]|nr:hypothetical protein [bacterium]